MTVRLAVGDQSAAGVASRAIERIRGASERASMRSLRGQCAAAARAVDAIAHGATDDQLVEDIAMLDRQLELYMSVYRETTALDAGPSLLTAMSSQVNAGDHGALRDELAALITQVNIPSL